MSRDHFIAQTYLRHFGDPSARGMMHAYRKSDGNSFPCHPKDVCHEWDGDQNPLLVEQGLLGDYRKVFEPQWRSSVAALLEKALMPADMFAISGYFANLIVCTPAWVRVGVEMYDRHAKAYLSFAKKMHERHGGVTDLPVDAIEMLEKGQLSLSHDPNYLKAKATQQLLDFAWRTYHQDWTIIRNPTDYPFVTSDNPVAIDQSPSLRAPATRYLPMSPTLCLSVRHDRDKLPAFDPTAPPLGHVHWVTIKPQGAKAINKLVAQCAEDLVFSSRASSGIERLVKNCAGFRVEAEFMELPGGKPDAVFQGSIIRVRDARLRAATSGEPQHEKGAG